MKQTLLNRRQIVKVGGSVTGVGLLSGCTQLFADPARVSAKPAASWWHAHCPNNFAVVNILRGGTELVVRVSASMSEIDRDVELTSWILTQLLYVDGSLEGELLTVTTPQAGRGGVELNPATELQAGDVFSNIGTGRNETADGDAIPASSVATETFEEPPSPGRLVNAGYQGFVTEFAMTEPLRETGGTKMEGNGDVTLAESVDRNSERGEIQAHVIGQRIDHADDVVVIAGWIHEREADLLDSFIGDVTFVDAGTAETDQPGSIVHPEECPEDCTALVETLMSESRQAFEDLQRNRESSEDTR